MATEAYGCSDDLVEVDGDVRGEVGCYNSSPLLVFSDGTVLSFEYAKTGIWKCTTHRSGELLERVDVCDDPDAERYSDTAHFGDGIKWCLSASEWEGVQ